jgi:hypothetical protein
MSTLTNQHRNQEFLKQSLHWTDLDNRELWLNNMQDPAKRQQLISVGFDQEDAIIYSMNSHGFRSDEFDDSPGFIALGCSFTYGIGLPQDQIWPSIVSRRAGLRSWNLGIGGCGLDTCFRLLYNWVDRLRPKFVMMLTPLASRFEIHHLGLPVAVMHNSPGLDTSLEQVKKVWFADDQNSAVNHVKNMLAIQQLCDSRNIKLITRPLHGSLLGLNLSTYTWPAARDLCHVGHVEQQYCAEKFLQALDQN